MWIDVMTDAMDSDPANIGTQPVFEQNFFTWYVRAKRPRVFACSAPVSASLRLQRTRERESSLAAHP